MATWAFFYAGDGRLKRKDVISKLNDALEMNVMPELNDILSTNVIPKLDVMPGVTVRSPMVILFIKRMFIRITM
jgi:hypothetical protein